jgi:NADH dehydrogenase
VRASPAASWLEVDADRAGRIQVAPDLSVTRRNGAYPIGDTVEDEKSPPGLGQVAGTALSENLKHGTAFLPSGFIIAATQRLVAPRRRHRSGSPSAFSGWGAT